MQSCKLPIEVCERVIDHLALSAHGQMWNSYVQAIQSRPTLYACLLVCRDWVHRSQLHLFRCVELRTTRGAEAFLAILARHPQRAQLVQFLTIAPFPPPSPSSSPEPVSPSLKPSDSPPPTSSTLLPSNSTASPAPPVTSSSSHSFQTCVAISNDQQSNVEKIPPQSPSGNAPLPSQVNVISRDQTQDKVEEIMTIPPCYYNWIYKVLTRLPPLLVNLSILYLYGLPTLHPRFIRLISCFKTTRTLFLSDLENQSFSEIIQIVNRLPQLRIIYLTQPKWDRPVRFYPSRPFRLEEFSCLADDKHMNTDTLDWLRSLQDLSRLRFLRIGRLQSSDWDKVHYILQQCMHSLRFLNLLSSDADISGSLSLSSHSKLECLDIWDPSLQSPNAITLFASHISQLLSPSLVYFIIGPFEPLNLESLATSQSSWKDIDNALGDPRLNRLAYFVMRLYSSSEGNTDHETLRATFQNILPQSYQRGILWVGRHLHAIREYRGLVQHIIFAKTMSASSALLGLSGPIYTYETPSDK
ncbi:hypothetical protein NLI96_g7416 [Meripilus lineatus]|uniref:F-box domain-containing protein n=1 Tax=Meripilus lineatus TaxID=2056292 RepID=A0AAD5YH97_9APHY|nr:hypothetical protein NLI96_g7416 [Physisporinus lineatus]